LDSSALRLKRERISLTHQRCGGKEKTDRRCGETYLQFWTERGGGDYCFRKEKIRCLPHDCSKKGEKKQLHIRVSEKKEAKLSGERSLGCGRDGYREKVELLFYLEGKFELCFKRCE